MRVREACRVGMLGALGVLAGACSPALGAPEMDGCPAQEPVAGAPCDAPMTCSFSATDAGSGCGPTFACESFAWKALGKGCPPPPPNPCPENLPTPDAPCRLAGQVCTFDVPGSCPGVFVATCGAGGEWSVANDSPTCATQPCPSEEPEAGTACDYPFDCTYTVTPPGCGPSTEDATCASGVWKIETGPACSPPP